MHANRPPLTLAVALLLPVCLSASGLKQSPRRFRDWSSASSGAYVAPSSPDSWLGGAGNWSNPADWSAGLPGSGSDVFINTGNDGVTLDTSATIQSLTLGLTTGFATSTLKGNNTAQTLNITGDLTVNQAGSLELFDDTFNIGGNAYIGGSHNAPGLVLIDRGSAMNISGNLDNSGMLQITAFGPGGDSLTVSGTVTNNPESSLELVGLGDVANFGTLANHGYLLVNTGTTLNLTNQPEGILDLPSGSAWDIRGTFNAGGQPALRNLQSIEGRLYMEGNTIAVTPGTGTLAVNSGGIVLNNAATLQVNGNLSVGTFANIFSSTIQNSGGNALNVNGNVSIGQFGGIQLGGVYGFDSATVTGSIANDGTLNLGSASLTTPMLVNGGFTFLQLASWMVVGDGMHPGTETPGYHQLPDGILGEIIAADHFGLLQTTAAYLDGTLAVLLADGFNPPVGSRYRFVITLPGELNGEFATIENDVFNGGTEKWVLDYNESAGYVDLIAESNTGTVPEPGSIWLLGTGMLGLAGWRKRRAAH